MTSSAFDLSNPAPLAFSFDSQSPITKSQIRSSVFVPQRTLFRLPARPSHRRPQISVVEEIPPILVVAHKSWTQRRHIHMLHRLLGLNPRLLTLRLRLFHRLF